jgi:hypothetical protein
MLYAAPTGASIALPLAPIGALLTWGTAMVVSSVVGPITPQGTNVFFAVGEGTTNSMTAAGSPGQIRLFPCFSATPTPLTGFLAFPDFGQGGVTGSTDLTVSGFLSTTTNPAFKPGSPIYLALCGQTDVQTGGKADVTTGKLFLEEF